MLSASSADTVSTTASASCRQSGTVSTNTFSSVSASIASVPWCSSASERDSASPIPVPGRFLLAGMAEERGKNGLAHLRRHDLAVVGHRDPERIARHRQPDADHRLGIFQGVVHQVAQNLGESLPIDLRMNRPLARVQFEDACAAAWPRS